MVPKDLTFRSADELFNYVADQFRPLSVGFDTMLGDLAHFKTIHTLSSGWPRANIVEVTTPDQEDKNQKGYLLELALAGIPKEDLTIELKDDILTVKYEKDDVTGSDPRGDRKYLHQEVAYRAFTRSWKLGPDIQVGAASYEDGVLSINFTKVAPEEELPRLIEIK